MFISFFIIHQTRSHVSENAAKDEEEKKITFATVKMNVRMLNGKTLIFH
jgi:hypothetical protein